MLITGGTGFLAKGLVKQLLADGCRRICLYSRGEYAQARMRAEFDDDPRLRWLIGDVRDASRLERAMERCSTVIHAASLKRIEVGAYCPEEFVKTNVIGTMNVIEAARKAAVDRVVFVSSDKAFEPVSPYGQTKALAESLVLTADATTPYGPRYSCVRYGNIWNSTGGILPTWREILKTGDTVPVRNPEATRFFMLLHEAVSLVLNTARTMRGGEIAIPQLPAYRVGDLPEAMGVKTKIVGMGPHEKLHEKLNEKLSSNTARRMSIDELREALASV